MRVKRGTVKRRRHKKYLKAAKGYLRAKSRHYRSAKNQVERSMQYSTIHRKQKKRLMRKLWISRINAACRENGLSYSKFIASLKVLNVRLNRYVLQEIAMKDNGTLKQLIEFSQKTT